MDQEGGTSTDPKFILDCSISSDGNSLSLRRSSLSNRRKGRGSSIVLTSQRLNEITEDPSSQNNSSISSNEYSSADISIGDASEATNGMGNNSSSNTIGRDKIKCVPALSGANAAEIKRKYVLQRLSLNRANELQLKLQNRKKSALAIQRAWRTLIDRRCKQFQSENKPPSMYHGSQPANVSHTFLLKILTQWRKYRGMVQIKRYLQWGQWKKAESDILFSRLILGPRVRMIIKSKKMKGLRSSIADIISVSTDILKSARPPWNERGSENVLNSSFTSVVNILKKIYNGGSKSHFPFITSVDFGLLQNLSKQYFALKQTFYALIFGGATFLTHPNPGYWDLSTAVRRCFDESRESRINLKPLYPPRNSIGTSGRTPDRLTSSKLALSSSRRRGDMIGIHATPPRISSPVPSKLSPAFPSGQGSINKKNLAQYHIVDGVVSPFDTNTDDDFGRRLEVTSSNNSPNITRSLRFGHASINDVSSSSEPIRSGAKAHLQLNIFSGEKLMPAKKGSANRDSQGDVIPDRRPCLKVSLLLPQLNCNSSPGQVDAMNNMKKVYTSSREYSDITLCPQWNTTFNIPLACPRHIIIQEIPQTREAANKRDSSKVNILDSHHYEQLCIDLLDWWASGCVKIEVFDAERFNEEIFLGEVSLLISNFLVPKKLPFGPGANRLTPIHIKGIFPLNKIQATDRVSGSISLDAYLHFPDPQYLANVINIQRKSSNISLAMKLSNSLDLNSIMGYNGNEIFQNGRDERSLFSENSFRDLSVMQSNSLPPERMISMQSRSLIEDTSIHSVGNPKVTNAVANSLGSPERTTSVLGTSSGEKKSQQSKVELKRLAAKFNANISNRQRNNLLRETELNSQISLDDNSSLYLKSQLDHPLSKENSPTMIENPAFLDIRVSRNLRSYSSPAKMIKSESSYHNGRNDATLDLNPSMLLSPMRPDLKQVSSPNSLPNSASGKIQATPESVQLNNQQRSTVSEISSGNVLSSFQRRTRLADLSKCLDTLSSDIKSADAVIGDLNRKLEGKVETRIS